jgi:dihydroflavonol-4-reductase
MNVLVTGATGFIGSSVCRALVAQGHRTRAFHRSTSSLKAIEGLPLEHALGDILDLDSLRAAMAGAEVVVHCAAQMGTWRDPARMTAGHVTGTRNVVQAALRAGVRRLIYTSSVAALGVPDHPPSRTAQPQTLIDETHDWNYGPHLWQYGYAKHIAEQEVRQAIQDGLEAVIVNPSAVFGAGDVNRTYSSILLAVARGRIPFCPPGGLNAVHIDDVVQGHLAAIQRGRPGERYILGGENLSLARLLAITAEVVGRRPPRLVPPTWLLRGLALPIDLLSRVTPFPVDADLLRLAGYYFYYDTRKAQTELGLTQPRPYRLAAEHALAWYRQQGLL